MQFRYLAVFAAAIGGWFIDPMLTFVILLGFGDAKVELAIEVDYLNPSRIPAGLSNFLVGEPIPISGTPSYGEFFWVQISQ